jgi:hypothetical protein
VRSGFGIELFEELHVESGGPAPIEGCAKLGYHEPKPGTCPRP